MNCPICGDEKTLLEEKLPEVDLYYCSNCPHRFSNPSSIDKKEEYLDEYYMEKHKKWFENPNLELFSYLYDKIVSIGPNASVLDVGCGDGAFLRYLAERSPGLKLTGVDYHHNRSTEGIKYYQGDIFDINFEAQFDVVVNLAVIEHVWDVRTFIGSLTNMCRKGGVIATMTVNDQSLIYRISRLVNQIGINSPKIRLYEKHHLNHFSKESLRYLLENEGLRIEHHYSHVPKMNTIDTPPTNSLLVKIFQLLALSIFFKLEILLSQTILQTTISKRI